MSGLTYRLARDASELRSSFNTGRAQRGTHMTDLGSVHERAASLFTVQLSQFAPAAVPGEEDRVLVRAGVAAPACACMHLQVCAFVDLCACACAHARRSFLISCIRACVCVCV